MSSESMNEHKAHVASDSFFDIPLPLLEDLPPNPIIKKKFVSKALRYEDFTNLLQSRRNGSSPGINMILYKVYKKCPRNCVFSF